MNAAVLDKTIFSVTDICPGVTFNFPRDNQETDYVRYRSYFPSLTQGTICLWVNTNDHGELGGTAVLSYAVPSIDNEILIAFQSSERLTIWLKGREFRNFDFDTLLSGVERVSFVMFLSLLYKD